MRNIKDILKFVNTNLIRDIIPVFDGYDMARNNKVLWESVDADGESVLNIFYAT